MSKYFYPLVNSTRGIFPLLSVFLNQYLLSFEWYLLLLLFLFEENLYFEIYLFKSWIDILNYYNHLRALKAWLGKH